MFCYEISNDWYIFFNGQMLLSRLWKRNCQKSWRTLVRADISSTFCWFKLMSGRTNVLTSFDQSFLCPIFLGPIFSWAKIYLNQNFLLQCFHQHCFRSLCIFGPKITPLHTLALKHFIGSVIILAQLVSPSLLSIFVKACTLFLFSLA